jgi:glycerol-3-phosphate acyltransferase PlsY
LDSALPAWFTAGYLLAAYLFGSIPTAYLFARWLKGVDLRQYGSANVGANNAGAVIGLWAMGLVGVIDMAKAALPAWFALHGLEQGYPLAVSAGLCALAGHNWSIFIGFYGGRGVGTIMGTLLVVFPWGALILLAALFIGWRLHSTAGSTVGLLLLPIASLLLDMPLAVTLGSLGMILITAAKRLEANRAPLPVGEQRWSVIWRRLWLDRDIADHEKWLARRPGRETGLVLDRDDNQEKIA